MNLTVIIEHDELREILALYVKDKLALEDKAHYWAVEKESIRLRVINESEIRAEIDAEYEAEF